MENGKTWARQVCGSHAQITGHPRPFKIFRVPFFFLGDPEFDSAQQKKCGMQAGNKGETEMKAIQKTVFLVRSVV